MNSPSHPPTPRSSRAESLHHELRASLISSSHSARNSIKHLEADMGRVIITDLEVLEVPFSELETSVMIKTFVKLIKPSLLLAISQSGNNIVNTLGFYIAGRSHDVVLHSSFGLGIFFNTITIYTLSQPIIEKIGVSCSFCYGKSDYHGFKLNFTRGVLTFCCYIVFLFLPIIYYSEEVLLALGIEEHSARLCSQIQKTMLPLDIVKLSGEILFTFSICQGIESNFWIFNLLSLAVSLILGCFFGLVLQYGIYGWMIARAFFEVMNFSLYLFTYLKRTRRETRGFAPFASALEGLADFLKDVLKFTFSLYSEVVGFELSAILTTLTKDPVQIVAHTSFINVSYFVYNIGLGFSNTVRTRINYLLGRKTAADRQYAAKNFFIVTLVGLLCSSLVLGSALIIFRQELAWFYSANSAQLYQYLASLFVLYGLVCFGDFGFTFMFTIARSSGQLMMYTALNVCLLIGSNFLMGYYSVAKLHGTCLEVIEILYFNVFLVFIMINVKLIGLDWSDLQGLSKPVLQEIELQSVNLVKCLETDLLDLDSRRMSLDMKVEGTKDKKEGSNQTSVQII